MPTHNVDEFELWQPNYGGATVIIYIAGTTSLASVFTDEALTVAASNPQTLSAQTVDGISYGKFAAPLYTSSSYTLDIDSTDQTGIERPPLTTLAAQDASDAVVTPTGGTVATPLDDIVARVVHAEDYGELGASAATNNTTLTAAIGAASGNGGGIVVIPDGTYSFTGLTIPTNVIIQGSGRGVTTIQCTTGAAVLTLSGDRAGISCLTLDGVSLVASSIGVYAKAVDEVIFDDAEVKRFNVGIQFKGARRLNAKNLYIDNCATGAKFHGDNDAGGGADGDQFRDNIWSGGVVSQCTTYGIDLSYEDMKCYHNTIRDVGFESSTGTALNINGARFTTIEHCWWSGNTTSFAVGDDDDTDSADENTVIGLTFDSCDFYGGAATLTETCQDVVFQGCEIADVDFTITLPTNSVLATDCIEDSLVTFSGDGDKWIRFRRINHGSSSGVTTGASATKAWAVNVAPGQVGLLEAKVLANRRDGTTTAAYHKVAKIVRPGSTLAYDNQTANFTVGDVLTGGTSGATARISADADGGATGTLTLRDIVGTFENNETITDVAGGSADVNGTITNIDCVVDQADTLGTDFEDVAGWDAAWVANGGEVELQVTGAASTTIEWLVHVEAVMT